MRFRTILASVLCILSLHNGYVLAQLDPLVYEQEFAVRKQQLIDNMADQYAPRAPGFRNTGVPDPEKFNWPAVCARFDKYGLADDTANARIRRFANNSPFHFTLVGMARIMEQYAQAPAMVQTKATYLRNVWNRTDSYNAFTSEGTENHNNMSKPAGYLYAQYSLGNPAYPQAATRLAEMKAWILDWSKLIMEGGHGEWNSSTYNTWSVAGWLNLYDFATDPDVKLCARAVLDLYALEQAVNYQNGVTGGAEMRGNALSSVSTDSDYLNWLWFDDNPRRVNTFFFTRSNNSRISATYAAVSSYRPPMMVVELARKQLAQKANYKIGYPDYLILRQGYIPAHLYAEPAFTLGSAFMPYGGYTGGDFQVCSFKLIGRVSNGDSLKSAQVISGSGRYYNTNGGKARQPYDQYVQHENVLMQLTRVPLNDNVIYNDVLALIAGWRNAWQPDFSARFPGDGKPNPVSNLGATVSNFFRNTSYMSWPTAGVQVQRRSRVVFLDMEQVYVALRTVGRDSVRLGTESSTRALLSDTATYGALCGIVLEARAKSEYSSFTAFQDSIITITNLDKSQVANLRLTYRDLRGNVIAAQYQENGTFSEPIYDWGHGITQPSINQNLAGWQSATWPTGAPYGRQASWTVNGQPVSLNGYKGIVGPNVNFANNVVRVEHNGRFYQIDYTGRLPVFSTNTTNLAGNARGLSPEPVLYPNPANHSFQVNLYAEKQGKLKVSLWNSAGKMVKAYENINLTSIGSQHPEFSLEGVGTGIYFCRLEAYGRKWTKRLVVEK